MKKLKGALIGAGYFSQFHLEAWGRISEVDLVAVCDSDLEVARTAARQFRIDGVYSDAVAMMDREDLDFVDIVTRPNSHLALTRAAADRSIAVICQKPLAPTFDESQALVAVASKAGIPLMVHENFRFQPWYREIKRLLDQGVLGDRLHSISIRTRMGDGWQEDAYLDRQPYFRTMPQLLVFETGVHFIDTMRYLGGEIDGVYASLQTLNPDIAGEDAATVMFEFASGARGLWDANRFNEPNYHDPRYTFGEAIVEGNGGTLRLSYNGRLTLQPLGEIEREHVYSPSRSNFAGDCVFQTQKHFVNCLIHELEFETSGKSYLHTLRIQEAAYESARQRAPVRGLISQRNTDANH